MNALAEPDDVPFPLVEKGDFVRLKEPYMPSDVSIEPNLKTTIGALARDRDHPDASTKRAAERGTTHHLRHDETYSDLFEFTHGTVVEIVSRFPAREMQTRAALVQQYDDHGGGPVRNVSLHLFNPDTGLMYVGGHPTESGKPEFVDHHVAELVLVHKHDESWGNEYDIDIAEVYAEWGIEGVGIPPTEG